MCSSIFARRFAGWALSCAWVLAAASAVAGPLDTVREFVRLDGRGHRLRPFGWVMVAPLVTWSVEPAWDHVTIIRGLEVRSPHYEDEISATIEIEYTIVGDVRYGKYQSAPRLETRKYLLIAENGLRSWRIAGSPPVPALFETSVDVAELAASFDAEKGSFLTSSAFVWRVLRERRKDLEYTDTQDLPRSAHFEPVLEPAAGDVVVYYDRDRPYHVGIFNAGGAVLSATLIGGVQRTEIGVFPGVPQYYRLKAVGTPRRN